MKNPITVFLKALQQVRHPSTAWGWGLLPRTRLNYAAMAGDGQQSAIIAACIRWIMRTFPEAPLAMERSVSEETPAQVTKHPLLQLLELPNPFYDGLLLNMSLAADFALSGNAYVLKARNGSGTPIELWWAPSPVMEPKFPQDGSIFISHYDYTPSGIPIRIEPQDVVHFRYGLDSRNPRKGLSPLLSLFREIFTDDEAANMSAALLRNMGIPGIVVSPEGNIMPDGEGAKAVKEFFKQNFTGDERGLPLVMSAPTKIQEFGFSPQQMDMKALRRIPEERISAVLGVPAIVAGLGAGLDRSTFANMAEAREMVYESTIVPMQRLFSAVWKRQLLGDFEDKLDDWKIYYDLSNVRVLQEDQNKLALRLQGLVTSGIITVAQALQQLHLPSDESHDIYLRPMVLIEVPAGMAGITESPGEIPAKAIATKARVRLTAAQRRLNMRLIAEADRLEAAFGARLEQIFGDLGKSARAAIADHLPSLAGDGQHETKQTQEIGQAVIRMALSRFIGEKLTPAYKGHYKLVAEMTFVSVSDMFDPKLFLEDTVATRILEMGGRRVGLIDLEGQTKDAMFRALRDGRDAGESTRELAKRVENYVSAGRYKETSTRAMVVARTETKYAQVQSSLEAYGASAVIRGVMLLDAQLGPTDAICEARNGQIVSVAEAQQALEAEHPQGTLAVVPITR